MQILENMESCYGCGACYNACPVGAISMQYNGEGFKEPVVDDSKCISCNKCKKVCIATKDAVYDREKEPRSFAFASSPSEMKECSSGAAFPALAREIMADGGAVFAAVYNESCEVIHQMASDENGMKPMRMSKYVQSDQGDCYKKAKEALDAGRKVLYVGCPCQIAGLRSFLGGDHDNLFTIDLICHGAPAPGLLAEHLDNVYGRGKVKSIRMRKKAGWGTCFAVTLKSGKTVNLNSRREIFMLAFLKNVILRRTCYGCRYSKLPRQGDLTLGDFWNKKKLDIKLGDSFKKKCSIVYINSEKGSALFSKLTDKNDPNIHVHELTDLGYTAAQLNNNIGSAASSDTSARERFYAMYPQKGFEKAAYAALYPDKKERTKIMFSHRIDAFKAKFTKS